MFDPLQLVDLLFTLIYLSILARIILTLVLSFMTNDPPPMLVNITQVFIQVTEPILAPIRRVLPTFGMIDFSPLVAILLLTVIQRILMAVLQ
ncbi:MAG: YggT family protein [Chloroflexi bacterium]|nr:YggT family protein [Chloroflexota bacterium]